MAAFKNLKDVVINVDSSTSDDSSEEIEVVKELKTGVVNHRCDLCCEGEFLIDKLLRFGGLINEEYKFVCDKCDKNFIHKSELKKHSTRCEGLVFAQNGENSFVNGQQTEEVNACTLCSKNYKSKSGLTRHMKKLHSGLIHTCELCKKIFSNFQQFRLHCHEHEQKKFLCTFCKKSFRYEGSLKKHIAQHNLP